MFVLLFTASLLLAGCKKRTDPGSRVEQGEIIDENDVQEIEVDTDVHNYVFVSQNGNSYAYKCIDDNEVAVVKVEYVSGTRSGFSVSGNTITFKNITADSVYAISGDFYGNIVIDVTEDYKFELELKNFNLYSYHVVPITVLSGDHVTISAKHLTSNYLFDLREAVDEASVSASIYAECDLDIQGKGNLYVKSVNNNGIHTQDDLEVKNLTLQVECKDNALKGNDSVSIESGNIILIASQGDGIKTENSNISSKGNQRGTIAITGGKVLIYAAADGIDASYDVMINENDASVSLQIFTDRYSKYSETVTDVTEGLYYIRNSSSTYKYSLKYFNDGTDVTWSHSSSSRYVNGNYYYPMTRPAGYKYVQLYIYSKDQTSGQEKNYIAASDTLSININYNTIVLTSGFTSFDWANFTTTQPDDSSTDKSDYSTRGIKADNEVLINAGKITISSYDDSICAKNDVTLENGVAALGNVTVTGGDITLFSKKNGIQADNKATISGGAISIVNSYEGIQGKIAEIAGGNVSIISSDDGINGTGTSGESIIISGGYLYVYSKNGDGIDSNSTSPYDGFLFSGGHSVIISFGQKHSSLDSEEGYKYTGGYVVAIGRSGEISNESTKSSPSISSIGKTATIDLQSDNYLVIFNIVTVKMPASINASVIFLGNTNVPIYASSSNSNTLDANGVYWK
jgi:hypothetical protein